MVVSDADSLGKAAKGFSKKPFLGASLGTSSAPFIKANFDPKVEWHCSIAPADSKTYQAVKCLICTCIHCAYSMKTGVTQDEDRYKLKQFNPAKYMEHLRNCPKAPETVREQVLSVGANNGGKRAREKVEEIRKREQEELAQNKQDDPQAKELQSLVKKARTPSDAEKVAEERQQTLDSFVTTDPNVTQSQYNLGMWFLSVFFIMDRIPFFTMDSEYFRKVSALRLSKSPVLLVQFWSHCSETELFCLTAVSQEHQAFIRENDAEPGSQVACRRGSQSGVC